jgi:peptidoglycan hydrolase CwlO-like protein
MARKRAKQNKTKEVNEELDSKLIDDLASEPKDIKLEDTVKLKAAADVADTAKVTEDTYKKLEQNYVDNDPKMKETFEKVDKLEDKYSKLPAKDQLLEKDKDELLDEKKTSDDKFKNIVEENANKFREQKGVTKRDFSDLFSNRRKKSKFQAP